MSGSWLCVPLLAVGTPATADAGKQWTRADGYTVPLYRDDASRFTGTAPAPQFLQQSVENGSVTVNYTGVTPEAQAAFQRAVDIWSSQLQFDVPVTVEASFTELGELVLGAAGPTGLLTEGTVWYPPPLANQVAGADLISGPEIQAFFSSQAPW